MLVAQITDTHLFAEADGEMYGCRTRDSFNAVIDLVAQLAPKPDVLLLTGDISQDDSPASYLYVRSRLQDLNIPTYWLPGNHDQNLEARALLNQGCISGDRSFVRAGWQFILLDSMVEQQPYGELSQQQLQFLDEKLSTNLPTLIAIHHQAIASGLTYMDGMSLQNAEALLARIEQAPHVKAVVNGHIHHEFSAMRHGVHFLGTPSTCVQLKPMQAEVEVDDRPAGFRLLWLEADGQMKTEVRRVAATP